MTPTLKLFIVLAPGLFVVLLMVAVHTPAVGRDEDALEIMSHLCVHGAFYSNAVVAFLIGSREYSHNYSVASVIGTLAFSAMLVLAAWMLVKRRRQIVRLSRTARR